jgi:hypothetical protein
MSGTHHRRGPPSCRRVPLGRGIGVGLAQPPCPSPGAWWSGPRRLTDGTASTRAASGYRARSRGIPTGIHRQETGGIPQDACDLDPLIRRSRRTAFSGRRRRSLALKWYETLGPASISASRSTRAVAIREIVCCIGAQAPDLEAVGRRQPPCLIEDELADPPKGAADRAAGSGCVADKNSNIPANSTIRAMSASTPCSVSDINGPPI